VTQQNLENHKNHNVSIFMDDNTLFTSELLNPNN